MVGKAMAGRTPHCARLHELLWDPSLRSWAVGHADADWVTHSLFFLSATCRATPLRGFQNNALWHRGRKL
jgi:hypothetical protein